MEGDILSSLLGNNQASNVDDYVEYHVYFDDLWPEATGKVDKTTAPLTECFRERGTQEEVNQFLLAKACHILVYLEEPLRSYVWTCQGFVLQPCFDGIPHLWGRIRVGDGIEDEWYVVSLLQQCTKALPGVSAQVSDNDGNFILIECALQVPSWLSPNVAENRVFLRDGLLHIIPNLLAPLEPRRRNDSPSHSDGQGLNIVRALNILKRDTMGRCVAKRGVQMCLQNRLQRFARPWGPPASLTEKSVGVHAARVILPAPVAVLIKKYPSLVAVALDHLPPPKVTVKTRRRLRAEPEGDDVDVPVEGVEISDGEDPVFDCSSEQPTVCVRVRFSRCQFARLLYLRFSPPARFSTSRWKLPAETVHNKGKYLAAINRGAKICLGLETAFRENVKSDLHGFYSTEAGRTSSRAVKEIVEVVLASADFQRWYGLSSTTARDVLLALAEFYMLTGSNDGRFPLANWSTAFGKVGGAAPPLQNISFQNVMRIAHRDATGAVNSTLRGAPDTCAGCTKACGVCVCGACMGVNCEDKSDDEDWLEVSVDDLTASLAATQHEMDVDAEARQYIKARRQGRKKELIRAMQLEDGTGPQASESRKPRLPGDDFPNMKTITQEMNNLLKKVSGLSGLDTTPVGSTVSGDTSKEVISRVAELLEATIDDVDANWITDDDDLSDSEEEEDEAAAFGEIDFDMKELMKQMDDELDVKEDDGYGNIQAREEEEEHDGVGTRYKHPRIEDLDAEGVDRVVGGNLQASFLNESPLQPGPTSVLLRQLGCFQQAGRHQPPTRL